MPMCVRVCVCDQANDRFLRERAGKHFNQSSPGIGGLTAVVVVVVTRFTWHIWVCVYVQTHSTCLYSAYTRAVQGKPHTRTSSE